MNRSSPERRQPNILYGLLVLAGLASCSVMQPIPKADGQGYFTTAVPLIAMEATGEVGAAVPQRCRSGAVEARDAACFADGLGIVMDRQEARRRGLLDMAREVVHTQVSFNSLLYPFGAIAVYEKLRGAPNHNLLLPAVIGTAAFGFLNSGIPEREKQYLQTAAELQCSLMWHGQWLYLVREINSSEVTTTVTEAVVSRSVGEDPARWASSSRVEHVFTPRSLGQVTQDLSAAIRDFQTKRAGVVPALEGRPGSGTPAGALERVKEGNGSRGKNTTDGVSARLAQQAALARATLQDLKRLRGDVAAAAFHLSADTDQIHDVLQRRLTDKLPALKDPRAVAKELMDPNKSLGATAEAGDDAAALMDPLVPRELLSGLSMGSRKKLADLAANEGERLESAWTSAQSWLDRHAQRQLRVRNATAAMTCGDSTLVLQGKTPRSKTPVSGRTGSKTSGSTGDKNGGAVKQEPLP